MATRYTPRIVTDGLVFCVDAGNPKSYPGSGTAWADLTKRVASGTLTNTPVFNQNNSGSLSYNGASMYTTFGDNVKFEYTDNFTLEAWVFYGPSSTTYAAIVSKEDYGGGSAAFGYGLKVDKTNYYPYLVVTGPSPTTTRSYRYGAIAINDNQWHHVVGVYTGGGTPSIDIYIDGKLSNNGVSYSFVANGGTATSSHLYVGTNAGGGYINANVATARIYNKSLTASEVLQNYNATKARFQISTSAIVTSNLVLNLDAGQLASYMGVNNTWYDRAGSNNGTLTNGPTFSTDGGGTIVFDGSNDYVSLGSDITLPSGSNWTINMAVKASSYGSDYGNILTNINGGPVYNAMGIASTGKMVYTHYDSAWRFKYANTTLSTGTWYYLTWVNQSNNTITMYVNGVADSSPQDSTTPTGNPVNVIGRNWASSYYSGKIANLSYYNTNLTAAQIYTNFTAVRGKLGI